MRLSICIPTRNRPVQLRNCLNSIYLSKKISNLEFDVCISDNGSNYDIKELIKEFDGKIKIKVNCNKENIGYQLNLIKTISMSDSEFVWAIGDDDLILPEEAVFLGDQIKPFAESSASFIFDDIFSNPTSLFAKGYSLNDGARLKYLLMRHIRVQFKIDALQLSTAQEKN